MSSKANKSQARALHSLLKRIGRDAASGSNAIAYNKFLARTLEQARTFDAADERHVDYVARDEARREKTRLTKATRQKQVAETGGEKPVATKKRRAKAGDSEKEATTPKKRAKKSKADDAK